MKNNRLWEKIIREAHIDLTRPVSYITTDKIKKITNKEPRLLAKMDSASKLPEIFKRHGVFLLPVSRRRYAIIKGKGYHELEPIKSPPIIHEASIPVDIIKLITWKITESTALNYAYQTDLLVRFLEVSNLYEYIRGRIITSSFTFKVDGTPEIKVTGAQIELDESFVSGNDIIIIEAKINTPKSFWIKQLYYPYRTILNKTKRDTIRSIFFTYEKENQLFSFWEYYFENPMDYESISLIKNRSYQIKVKPYNPKDFIKKDADLTHEIPQADSFEKVLLLPIYVHRGYKNSKAIAKVYGFHERQSNYYRQAAEMLGLVELRGNDYILTKLGEEYIKKTPKERINMSAMLLLRHPIVREIFVRVISNPNRVVTKRDVMKIIKSNSHLTGSTIERRARTIFSWFKWLQRTIGIVQVTSNEIKKLSTSSLERYIR